MCSGEHSGKIPYCGLGTRCSSDDISHKFPVLSVSYTLSQQAEGPQASICPTKAAAVEVTFHENGSKCHLHKLPMVVSYP